MEEDNDKRKAKDSSHSPSKRLRFYETSMSSLAKETRTENETEVIPSTSTRNVSVDEILTPKEMQQISSKFFRKESRHLARMLNLSNELISEIEAKCPTDQNDDEEFTYQILEEWQRRSGNDATRIALKNALIDLGRKDIVNQVFPSGCVTDKEINRICLRLRREQHRLLARELNLTDQVIEQTEVRCTVNQYGDGEIVYGMLRNWKETNGENATRMVLKKALVNIGRRDIAEELYSDLPESVDVMEMQKKYQGIQVRIEEKQRQRCQRVQLPQVSWTEKILPLEDLYVSLELMKTVDEHEESRGEPIRVEELFNPVNEKKPVRILVEGGPGYGKTTLCLKLLNDFGKRRAYMCKRFKMIFLFQLRNFEQNSSFVEMIRRECEAVGVNGEEGISCIEAFEKETLIILDGFDEMNEEGKKQFYPLIQEIKYPSFCVVVTSRRGMFEVRKRNEHHFRGYFEMENENVNAFDVWCKRVLIKGVTKDKVETFLRNYLEKDYEELKGKIDPIIGGEMKEVFECPLFLILLAMTLEEKKMENVDSKTTLFKEFFNFIVRRNLIREKKLSEEEEVDIFDETNEHFVVQSLHQFGRLSVEYLCDNKLTFEEKIILENCKDEIILKLGFLTKIPNMEGHERKKYYQPIHKSFLEFLAAFSTWHLFKRDENKFEQEIERLGEKGLKPTDDSLFYVFLGGFMNSRSHALFQTLSCYHLWFNIESLCFTNILSEIKDIRSFFPSFQPILDSFIPSYYRIHGANGLTRDYFQSEIHSLILKYSSDRQLIKVFYWDSSFIFNLSQDLYFDCLELLLTDVIPTISSNENKTKIKCKNIICSFYESFETKKWKDFISLLNSIQSEKVHFSFDLKSNEINSLVLNLLHEELIEGRWKQKNIDRLRFELNEFDDPRSLSLLVDLVKKNRINEGVRVWIRKTERRREEWKKNLIKTETEELFNSIIQSKTIQEFNIDNLDSNFSPDFQFHRFTNFHLKKMYFNGSLNLLNSYENKEEKYELEEVQMTSLDKENNVNWIRNFRGTKYLWCHLIHFNTLFEMEWPGLKVIEELTLSTINSQSVDFLNSVSQLTNLQVLSLELSFIETVPSSFKPHFIHLFSSLRLRICEFLKVQNLELFSFSIKMLMQGMMMKEEEENKSIIGSNEGKKVHLQELVIYFDKMEIDFDQWKKSDGVQRIKTMLRNQHLKQCCFVDFNHYNVIKSDEVELLFPSKEKFRIFHEVDGMDQIRMNPNSSRQSQFVYRWFSWFDRFCTKYIEE